jgi:predicted ATPase/DNA-binding SARP family transcriptional activator
MDFRILGPLEVAHDGNVLELPGAKARALLAILLLNPNEAVSTDRLIDELWGADPPDTALNTLQVYVSQLRKVLRAGGGVSSRDLLVTKAPGYLLRVESGQLDSEQFEELVAAGRESRAEGKPAAAVEALKRADALWRGPPLGDAGFESFAQVAGRLEEERLAALEDRFEAELDLGGHVELVAELETMVARHPFREGLRRQLMVALYRAGRQADALAAYQAARQALVEELGIEPSQELQRLEKAILMQDVSLDLPEQSKPVAAAESAKPTPSREMRKSISVLCAEVGATPGDPEALRRSLDRLFDEGLALVSKHGGRADRLVGDTLLAVFGVPTLHEDDALRAVGAAAELRKLVARAGEGPSAVRLDVRIGITTGEVVTIEAGDGPGDVTGEAVSGAARLARSAADGEILISESTRQVTSDAVEVEPSSAGVWRLLEVVPGAPSFRRHLDAPMVGRDAELAQLRQTFDRAVSERTTHLLTVLGPAGIGKSRLATELVTGVESDARVLVGRTPPYGEGITFRPLAEIVRQVIGDGGLDAIRELVSGESEADVISGRVAAAVGLAEHGGRTEETFWAVRKFFEAIARERPLIVVFDDVHWAEPTLLDLVDHIVDWARDAPMLIVCLSRPELLEERPQWATPRSNRAAMFVEPLSDEDCEALIDNLLEDVPLAERSRLRIAEAGEGNPLFIEQLLALVLERGESPEELSIPPTIHALLAARLDRLGSEERTVLECAAVIGRDFWLEAVRELVPEAARPELLVHVRELLHKELIRPGGTTVVGGEAFRFRHILIRDAAYESISRRVRADLHERFALWLGQQADERLPEVGEIVGYHLEQAHRHLSELGLRPEHVPKLAARAGELLAPAGRRAHARGDIRSAGNLLSRAALLLPEGHPNRGETLVDLAEALLESSEFERAETMLEKAIRAAEGDRALEARATVAHLRIQIRSDPEISIGELRLEAEGAIDVFEQVGDEVGLAKAWTAIAWLAWVECRAALTDTALQKAIEHARRAGDLRTTAACLHLSAGASLLGPMPVTDGVLRCEEIVDARPDPRTTASALRALAALRAMEGSFDEARRLFEREEAILEDFGQALWSSSAWEARGIVEMLAGDAPAAEQAFRSGYEICERLGEMSALSTLAAMLAQAVYEQGRYEEALTLGEISEQAAAAEDLSSQVQWRGPSAKALARKGRKRKAEALAREAVALANETDFLNFHAGALVDLAEVLRLGGRQTEAAAAMAEAVRLYEEKGNTVFAARARTLLRSLGGAPGPSARATPVVGTRKGA